ncbi:hypothetical protein KA005_38720 [bacterium]|nr:hypothetical protein [bacterium]
MISVGCKYYKDKAKLILAGCQPVDADKEEIETLKAVVSDFEIKAALQTTITHLRR